MSSSELERTFEEQRPLLLGIAYRMLGSMSEAEDVLQDAWIRWQSSRAVVEQPRAYLARIVTNLCLNHLSSARVRTAADPSRLPEPVDLDSEPCKPTLSELADDISMAFMVLLQRMSAGERAAFLLFEVFEHSHAEVADILGRSESACRKLVERARGQIAKARRARPASAEDHRRLLAAFARASVEGDLTQLTELLAEDASLTVDSGSEPAEFGKVRRLPHPVHGGARVAAFCISAMARGPQQLDFEIRELNGRPAIVAQTPAGLHSAIMIDADPARVTHIYIVADPTRLARLTSGVRPR